jgi:uncharacterized DUF497 family protein
MRFIWNATKARENITKHRVSFEEASTVFMDPLAWIHDDSEHSEDEYREIIVGTSALGRLLLVCFTERAEDLVRIFSARTLDNDERRDYEENVH